LKDFQSAAQVPLAVVSGDADLGVTAFTAGFFNLAAKGGLKVVAAQSAERPGYQLNVIAVTNPAWEQGVRSVKDLAGKRVAVTTVGSSVHYRWRVVARKYGVDTKALTIWALQSIPNMVAAFKGGQVDAAVFPITTFRQVESEGSGKPNRLCRRRGAVAAGRGLHRAQDHRRATAAGGEVHRGLSPRGRRPTTRPSARATTASWWPGPNYDEMIGLLSSALKQPPALGRVGHCPSSIQKAGWMSATFISRSPSGSRPARCHATPTPNRSIDLSFVQGHFNVPT